MAFLSRMLVIPTLGLAVLAGCSGGDDVVDSPPIQFLTAEIALKHFEAKPPLGFEIIRGGDYPKARVHVFNEDNEEILFEFPYTHTYKVYRMDEGRVSMEVNVRYPDDGLMHRWISCDNDRGGSFAILSANLERVTGDFWLLIASPDSLATCSPDRIRIYGSFDLRVNTPE